MAQDLPRRGYTGFRTQFADGRGIIVTEVIPGTPADLSGIKTGDTIISVGGIKINSAIDWQRKISVLKANQVMEIGLVKNGITRTLKLNPTPVPREVNKNNTVYGVVVSGSNRLRTITTIPNRTVNGRLPAVLFIQWLSCGSLELPAKSMDGTDTLLRSFANSNQLIFMRVDRPGTGDSEGGPCVDCGLEEELGAYRSALAQLKKRTDVDTSRIFLFGISLGGSLAPIVGQGQNIAGYMVTGVCTQTWFEHMLDIERRRLKHSGYSPRDISDQVKQFTKFYNEYYIGKKTPVQVATEFPALKSLWYDDAEHQYGRPARFYHAVQDLNIEGAWQNVRVPVLVAFGENDWIMSYEDHARVKEIVDMNGRDLVTFKVLKGLDHNLDRYQSAEDSFNGKNGVMDASANNVFMSWIYSKIAQGR